MSASWGLIIRGGTTFLYESKSSGKGCNREPLVRHFPPFCLANYEKTAFEENIPKNGYHPASRFIIEINQQVAAKYHIVLTKSQHIATI